MTRVADREARRLAFFTSVRTGSSGIPISAAAISACCSWSSVMPMAAKIASSSVGGSRRTRRVPYLVCQSSLIEASHIDRRYLRTLMLHCNMKLAWQSSHALQLFQSGCVVKLDGRGICCKRMQRADEVARRRDGKMRKQRGAIGPLFEEHQAQRVLTVDVHRMRDAAGLAARAMDVCKAKLADFVKTILPRRHASGHHDHVTPLIVISFTARHCLH